MNGRAVSIDGVVCAPGDATVGVYDRGFLYGDAVFEVLRTYRRRPFALGEHLARLRRSAERVFIELPVDETTLAAEIDAALAAAGGDDSYVRVMVTRGSGPLGLDPATATHPLRVVLVEPVVPPPRSAYADGIAAVTVMTGRTGDGTVAAGAKIANYLTSLLAVREAHSRGAQEALFVDGRGRVIEGASSNVFVVKDGMAATPAESAGILAGITRAHLIAVARSLGTPVVERDVLRDDVFVADEVFVSSSIREVLSVVRVDDRIVGAGRPGPVARALHRRFREAAGVGDVPMPWE